LIVEYGSMYKLMSLIAFAALIVFTVQGFRNLTGPRWLAIIGLLALILLRQENIQTGCYAGANRIISVVWLGSVALLFGHHAIQPRAPSDIESSNRRILRLASRVVVGVFVSLVALWFAFYQAMGILAGSRPGVVAALVSDVQRKISVPAYLILPFAGAVGLQQILARSKVRNER
jgi:hypothetical protein